MPTLPTDHTPGVHDGHDHPDHDEGHLQAWLKTALLAGLGLYFAYNIASGNLSNYVNARFAWLSYVATSLFWLLAAIRAYDLLRQPEAAGAPHGHHHHAHLSWPVLAVVATPLVLGTLVPSRPLGASAVTGNLSAGAVSLDEAEIFTTNQLEWNVLDWMRAINNSNNLSAFDGERVDLVGFVYRNEQFPPAHFMAVRFVISCCVADATAVGLPIHWADVDALPNDTWVQVQGAFQLGEFGGNLVPIVQAETVTVIDEPEHPYLYP